MNAPAYMADVPRRSLWNENAAAPYVRGHVPPVPDDAGAWLDTLIGCGQLWIFPPDFLPGARQIAGLDVRRAAGLALPYLAHPVSRLDRTTPTREDTTHG